VKEEPIRVAEMLTPRVSATPRPVPVQEFPSIESEPVQEELPELPELPQPVKIDAGSQPLAFGSLLESPVTEPEEDLELATTARPQLERDWKSGEKEDEVEEEEDEKHGASWRRDAAGESEENEPAAGSPVKDWRETAFAEAPARTMRNDSWAPQKEISSFEEAAESEQSVSAMVTDAPMAETHTPAPKIAPFTEDAWVAALNPRSVTVETAPMPEPVAPVGAAAPVVQQQEAPAEVRAQVQVAAPVAEPEKQAPAKLETAPEAEKPAAASSWFSAVSSPWDAEAQKASRLASTWDTAPAASETKAAETSVAAAPVVEAPVVETPEQSAYAQLDEVAHEDIAKGDPSATVDALPGVLSESTKARAEEAGLQASTVEAIREETQHITENAVQEAPAVDTTANAPEPSMEEMVAKVLAKMNPDVLQAVTRDILKNVVESMVRDELNSKKQ
jgi:hypothetical protein